MIEYLDHHRSNQKTNMNKGCHLSVAYPPSCACHYEAMLCTAYDTLNRGYCTNAVLHDELLLPHTSAAIDDVTVESYVRKRYRFHLTMMSNTAGHTHVGWTRWLAQLELDWLGTGLLDAYLPLQIRSTGPHYRGAGLALCMKRTKSGRLIEIEQETLLSSCGGNMTDRSVTGCVDTRSSSDPH